jgi:hypothetical protein
MNYKKRDVKQYKRSSMERMYVLDNIIGLAIISDNIY